MKPAIIFILLFTSHQLLSQSVYSQKWKESTFFQVPHSFDQTIKTDKQVKYVHEDDQASFEIKELPSTELAQTREELDEMAREVAKRLNYVNLEIIDQELLNQNESNADFIGSRLVVKGKGKKTSLTMLYSRKTQKNYVVIVEAKTKYYKENKQLVKQLCEGLREF